MTEDHGEETLGILATASVLISMAYTGVQDLNADFVSVRGCNLNFLDLEGLASTPANSSLADDRPTDCAHDGDCL
jgi:hypothetical protein